MMKITTSIFVILFSAILLAIGYAESNDYDVYRVQVKLKGLGYDPGSTDGIWGKKTTSALKHFQQDNGLPVTGQLDEQTRVKLTTKKAASQSSFIEAIKRDEFLTVEALIGAGADVNARDKSGETPLHLASVRGYPEITSFLIAEGAHVNARDERELTPLHAAAWGGHKETVALLIDKGAHVNALDENGLTPLHVSALAGKNETIALLIENGAEINARNKDGMTPLHVAAFAGQKEAAELLIEKGADVNAKNKEGLTALEMALQMSHQPTVELLRKYQNQRGDKIL
ncbi:MAG: ankyrin repeat domain-containing protein [Desulfobacterales bacterium]|jgi:ankyrin repeat protein